MGYKYLEEGSLANTVLTQYRNPGGTVNQTTQAMMDWDHRFTSGNTIDHFYKRLRRGDLLPMTAFSQYHTYGSSSGVYTTKSGAYTYSWSPKASISSAYMTRTNVMARQSEMLPIDLRDYVQAAASKIESQGFDALTFAAEFGKLLQMFSGIASTLTSLLGKGDWERSWLQYRYGWRTLYYDIRSFAEAVNSLDTPRVRKRETSAQQYTWEDSSTFQLSWTSATLTCLLNESIALSARGTVVADMYADLPLRMNPIATAWELVRFSFIIDWVLQVGQWLSAASFLLINRNYVAAGGLHFQYQRSVELLSAVPKSGWTVLSAGSTSQMTAISTERIPQRVSLKLSHRLKLDAFKVVDLMLILKQLLSRR